MKVMKRILSCQAHWRLWAPLCISVLLVLVQASLPLKAQQVKPAVAETQIAPTDLLTVDKAEVRTWEDMQKDEAARGSGPQAVVVPFRPTMDPLEYKQAKEAAAAAFGQKPFLLGPEAPLVAPIVAGADFDGVNQAGAGGGFPPDTHGAAGLTQYVQVTNQHIDVYDLNGMPLVGVSLNAFFGYGLQPIFDPRVVYDSTWNRWVISAEAFPESPTVQRQFLGISLTSDATGPFFKYSFNVLFDPNFFWDFPQLGMDQDSVIVTANYFDAGGMLVDARTFAVAKARLYNGWGYSSPLFTGLCGTLAPPIVLDQNDKTFLVCAPSGVAQTTVKKYTMTNSSRPPGTGLLASNITVPAYSIPPCAQQGAGNPCLDTSDARFVNASTQNGDSLWNAQTIDIGGGFPAPKYYEFNTATNTVIQQGIFFASGTSFDWNVSITANPSKDAFVTWSSTDPPTQAQVRFSGRCHGDPLGIIGAGTAVKTSPTFSSEFDGTRFRWGDYSAAAALQPPGSSNNNAWIVNEWTLMPTTWGSHITQIGFVPACP